MIEVRSLELEYQIEKDNLECDLQETNRNKVAAETNLIKAQGIQSSGSGERFVANHRTSFGRPPDERGYDP